MGGMDVLEEPHKANLSPDLLTNIIADESEIQGWFLFFGHELLYPSHHRIFLRKAAAKKSESTMTIVPPDARS